ncbi:hypothetical protein TRICI_003673 [Trichomonascus ciferrii]|uniref:HMG box domain-containing protein n=1 Tax=Trichomonascus ciferrii TaxID=44093 RepID=A0A642V8E6_9ASCO|nr:hypothetical protein TRICI_003673 [Trichomonascus ciferrii]
MFEDRYLRVLDEYESSHLEDQFYTSAKAMELFPSAAHQGPFGSNFDQLPMHSQQSMVEPNEYWSLPLEQTSSNCSTESSMCASVTPPLSAVDPSAFWTGVDAHNMISSPPPTMVPALSMKASNSSLSSVGSAASTTTTALTPPSDDSFLMPPQSVSPTPTIPYAIPLNAPMAHLPSSPPPVDPISFDDEAQNESARILQKHTYTKWVKLSRMTPERVEHIRQLAGEKGIDLDTVEAVLKHYLSPEKRIDNEVNRFCGEDVYIKITMGGGSFCAEDDSDSRSRRRSSVDGGSPKKKKHRKHKPNYVKRPLNSFMLYRKSQTQSAMAYSLSADLKLNHQNISQIIGLMWQTESKELKDEFAKFAGQEKEIHKALHPDYKFCPQKKKKQPQPSPHNNLAS